MWLRGSQCSFFRPNDWKSEVSEDKRAILDDTTALQMIKPDLAMAVGIRLLGNN